MKKAIFIGLALVSISAQADWNFRGTANGWVSTSLENVSGNNFQTCQTFGSDNPRFKIDRFGDWSENYPAGDYTISPDKSYQIMFNSDTHNITATQVSDCGVVVVADNWYFRGTANDWVATPMESSDNLNFCTEQHFADASPRFKIDHFGDWSENYPVTDFIVNANTTYNVCINAVTKEVTAVVVAGTDTQAPVVNVTPAAGSYSSSQTVTLSVTDNQDSAPQLYCTTDGTIPSALSANCNEQIFTAADVSATGSDLLLKVFMIDASGNSALASFDYNITTDEPSENTVIYYQNSANHSVPYLHYWAVVPALTPTVWPGEALELVADGWYKFDFTQTIVSANIIFNGSAGQTADLILDPATPCYQNNNWVSMDLCEIEDKKAPVVSASPAAGNYEEISLSIDLLAEDRDPNASLYYTLDGSTPTINSALYTHAIIITDMGSVDDAVIKVIAIDNKANQSEVTEFMYRLNTDITAPVVTASLPKGSYTTSQTVTFSVTDNNVDGSAVMYLTTDGSLPVTIQPLYNSQSITLDDGYTQIRILAVDALGNEKIYSFNYYIGSTPERTDFRKETIYFAMTTRFYDGDSSNNVHCWDDAQAGNPDQDPCWRGDFKGLIEKLDYLKALGFSAVWITPPVTNISGYDYHGYHASNFQQIDPRFDSNGDGSAMDEYQELIDAVHARGMKIIQDVVFNHSGNFGEENLHPLFKRESGTELNEIPEIAISNIAPAGMLPANYNTLGDLNTRPGLQFQSRIRAMRAPLDVDVHYHNHDFKGGWETYEVQIGSIAGDCQDLNTENPQVSEYIVDSFNRYIDMGVDAFRVDTVKHISRLTFNKEFVPAFKERGGENFFIFGEVATRYRSVWNDGKPAISAPFYTWKESQSYPWGNMASNTASALQHYNDNLDPNTQPSSDNHALNGYDYHTPDWSMRSGMDVIDFPMHWAFKNTQDAWAMAVGGDHTYNDATWNVTYVDSHDYAPDGAPENQRYAGSQSDWAEKLSLIFTFRGIPTLYYGSEIEFMKGAPIDVGPNAPLSTTGRAYFGDHLEGSVNVSEFGEYSSATGNMKASLEYPLAKHIRALNRIRRAVPALQMGQYKQFGPYKFVRRYTQDGVDSMALVVISGNATFSGLPNAHWVDLVTGDTQVGTTVNASAQGQGNIRVYVMNGEKIEGLTGDYIK
jgi:glycosidase